MNKDTFLDRYHADYWKSRTGTSVTVLSKLADPKYRAEYGLYLAEGVKLTEEALRHAQPEMVVVSEDALAHADAIFAMLDTAAERDCRIVLTSPEAFSKISTEKAPQGIIAVLPLPAGERPQCVPDGRYLLLDTIQDPGNLGTILRSASAFGIDGVITCGCADATSPKTVRASMGAVFRVPVWKTDSLADSVRHLREDGHRVLAAALSENCLCAGETPLYANDCVVIGNEGHGIAADVLASCTDVIRIPMTGATESLNASIAASILLWEYMRTFPKR